MVASAKTRLTIQDVLTFQDDTPGIVELIDGEVFVNSPFDLHQKAIGRIYRLLIQRVPGDEIRLAPMSVYFDEHNYTQPDLFWVSPDSTLCKLGDDGYWHSSPDLVIEVLSSSTARRDRKEKFRLYQQYGTREYWLVDPEGEYIETFRRENDRLVPQGIWGPGESFVSPLLGEKPLEVDPIFKG